MGVHNTETAEVEEVRPTAAAGAGGQVCGRLKSSRRIESRNRHYINSGRSKSIGSSGWRRKGRRRG